MLLYLDENRKILDNNFVISHASALKIMEKNPLAEWHEIDFSFAMGEDKPGMQKSFYLNEDNTIRIEYTEIPPREPTYEERMESKVDYIMMMQGEGGKDYA